MFDSFFVSTFLLIYENFHFQKTKFQVFDDFCHCFQFCFSDFHLRNCQLSTFDDFFVSLSKESKITFIILDSIYAVISKALTDFGLLKLLPKKIFDKIIQNFSKNRMKRNFKI